MLFLAEIADKMPTLETLWERWILVGLFMAAVTLGLSWFRWWLGAVVVVLSACLSVLLALPDRQMDPLIIQELGSRYFFQQRLSGFAPFAVALLVWTVIACIRWDKKSRSGNVGISPPEQGGGS
jgi:hypothetical protein